MKYEKFNSLMIWVTALIILLYVSFICIDIFKVNSVISSDHIKYLCIILCFLLTLLPSTQLFWGGGIGNKSHSNISSYKDILLLQSAMFITVIADLFLVILNFYILGVVSFSIVQIIYSTRHDPKNQKTTLINFFITFLCILLLYFILKIFVKEISILLSLAIFYAVCLLTSVTKAVKAYKNNLYPSPNKYMIALGMILFLLCDICVALSNATIIVPMVGHFIISLQQIASFLVWIFYVPSQLLLALSGIIRLKDIKTVLYSLKIITILNS